MANKNIHKIVTYCIAAVWIANGLFCKVLDFVPRHQEIVERITNVDRPSAAYLTILIGISEIIMAVWILSGYRSKLNTIAQIIIIASMNTLEFMLAPDLLLWGKLNSLFAFLFILVVYFNEFHLNKKQQLS
ncbi:MAG: DoxX-like family protein [Bacteroidota bacterium]